MKEHIRVTIPEGIYCDILAWCKENSSRLPLNQALIAKAAKIVLATPASEAICGSLFKRAKHIGTTDRMARHRDETTAREGRAGPALGHLRRSRAS